jgi:hypothetical protein
MIKCQPDTLRYIPEQEIDIFAIQESVIADIVRSSEEQVAIEAAPKSVDPVQSKIKIILSDAMNNPNFDRSEMIKLRRFIDQPMPNVHIRTLRDAYRQYSAGGQIGALIEVVKSVKGKTGELSPLPSASGSSAAIRREDLYLICFDYVWS